LAIALLTNYSYIAALHYLPASLNTAIFCSSPVFTLLLSLALLSSVSGQSPSGGLCRSLCSWQGLSVLLSVLGVVFIAEPWQSSTERMPLKTRMAGVGLSIVAALGTAIYQVYFKRTFGDEMKPDEVGLFLAYMGVMTFFIAGAVLACLLHTGMYALDLSLVPWKLVIATSLCSALFNFLIKVGLSRDTPVAVSLATQIGIPLNLMVDVLVVHAMIDGWQAFGTVTMLIAFSLQRGPPCGDNAQEVDARTMPAQKLLQESAKEG